MSRLSDFSGGGALSAAVNSWYLQADGKGKITSRWVMPFQRNCEFEIVNESHAPAHVKLEIISDNWNWDERSLYSMHLGNNPGIFLWFQTATTKKPMSGLSDLSGGTVSTKEICYRCTTTLGNGMATGMKLRSSILYKNLLNKE